MVGDAERAIFSRPREHKVESQHQHRREGEAQDAGDMNARWLGIVPLFFLAWHLSTVEKGALSRSTARPTTQVSKHEAERLQGRLDGFFRRRVVENPVGVNGTAHPSNTLNKKAADDLRKKKARKRRARKNKNRKKHTATAAVEEFEEAGFELEPEEEPAERDFAVHPNRAWKTLMRLAPQKSAVFDYFGSAVALSDDWVFVGSPLVDIKSQADVGGVYVYRRCRLDWFLYQFVSPHIPVSETEFGRRLSFENGTLFIGQRNPGVFRYTFTGLVWSPDTLLKNYEMKMAKQTQYFRIYGVPSENHRGAAYIEYDSNKVPGVYPLANDTRGCRALKQHFRTNIPTNLKVSPHFTFSNPYLILNYRDLKGGRCRTILSIMEKREGYIFNTQKIPLQTECHPDVDGFVASSENFILLSYRRKSKRLYSDEYHFYTRQHNTTSFGSAGYVKFPTKPNSPGPSICAVYESSAIIGRPLDASSWRGSGIVYIVKAQSLSRSKTPSKSAKIDRPSSGSPRQFGRSVSIIENKVAVAALAGSGDGSMMVYVYEDRGQWEMMQSINTKIEVSMKVNFPLILHRTELYLSVPGHKLSTFPNYVLSYSNFDKEKYSLVDIMSPLNTTENEVSFGYYIHACESHVVIASRQCGETYCQKGASYYVYTADTQSKHSVLTKVLVDDSPNHTPTSTAKLARGFVAIGDPSWPRRDIIVHEWNL